MKKKVFIGATDINGKKIAVGDFVKFRAYRNEKEQIAQVCYDKDICACTLERNNKIIESRDVLTKLFVYSTDLLEIVDEED